MKRLQERAHVLVTLSRLATRGNVDLSRAIQSFCNTSSDQVKTRVEGMLTHALGLVSLLPQVILPELLATL